MNEFLQLTEEQKMLRELTRDFVNKEIKPIAAKIDADEKIPRELIDKMGEIGFLGISFPEEYGGGGFGEVGNCTRLYVNCNIYRCASINRIKCNLCWRE
jgi:alkylation response protein AidB-like acyl-CoA dehydrogenase